MTARMTKEEGQAFKTRWARVNDSEREELRRTPMAHKLMQLAALMASVEEVSAKSMASEEAEVRKRWNHLRKAYIA